MSLISRAIPGLFGGVSQAIPAMRHPTQGELQENALSTVVAGLFKRPGSKHIAQLPFSWPAGTAEATVGNVHCHVVDQGAGKRWQLMLGPSGLSVVNMETGVAEPVTYQTAEGAPMAMPSYLTAADPQTAYRLITVADTTFIVNSEVPVESQNTDGAAPSTTTGWVFIRQGVQQHTYSIRVNGVDVASHTTDVDTTIVDDARTSTIASYLTLGINAAAGLAAQNAPEGITGLIQVTRAAGLGSLEASDSYGNTTMVVPTNGVPTFSHLPPRFVEGPRVTVTGTDAGAAVDPYYVRWDGTAKQWKETRKYGIATVLNASTMPHRVTREGGIWIVRPIGWDERLVGDDNTNPMPSFVGQRISDIFFYRNRLGFLAGDSLCMSRAGEYFNFFSTTAREVLDTDPIDISGSAESVERLDFAVPFNEQLLIWATSKQQFALVGGDTLTPDTARLVPTTAFESVNTARPRPLGNRVVFPSTLNGYTQMSLYRVAADTVSRAAEPVADHIPTYIPMNPRAIELSETAKTLCVVPPDKWQTMYVFKYEDDGDKLSQKAWQAFTFGRGILKAHWSGQLLYLTMLCRGSTPTGAHTLALEVMDFSPNAVDVGLPFSMRLDRRVFVGGAVATGTFGEYTVTAEMPDSDDLQVYRFASGANPVKLTVLSKTLGTSGGRTTVTLRVKAPAGTGTFVVGTPYNFRYTFTEVFMRDGDSVPLIDARLKLLKVLLRYVDTGYFKVTVTTKAQGAYEYTFAGQGVGLPGQLLGSEPVLVSGDFGIPVHAQAQGTVITVESDSHLPCCFPYAEWRGSLNMKSAR